MKQIGLINHVVESSPENNLQVCGATRRTQERGKEKAEDGSDQTAWFKTNVSVLLYVIRLTVSHREDTVYSTSYVERKLFTTL